MDLIRFLFNNTSRRLLLLTITTGIVNGVLSTLLLRNINETISGNSNSVIFLLLLVLSIFTYIISSFSMAWLSEVSIYSIRKKIISTILKAEYREIELFGNEKLYTSLTQDVGNLSVAISSIPNIVINISILVSCLLYIFWLSKYIALALGLTLIFGVGVYFFINNPTYILFSRNRDNYNDLFKYYDSVIYGIKEYKHDAQTEATNYNENFITSLNDIKQTNLKAHVLISLGEAWGKMALFILLGAIGYLLPSYGVSLNIPKETIVTSIIVTIFSLGSIYTLVGIFPILHRASISYKRVQSIKIKEELKQHDPMSICCDEIYYNNVEYTYVDQDDKKSFHIGPISLKIKKGEILLIGGGNGSGKTTLIKLLTGIYAIDFGDILCGNNSIESDMKHRLRELFTVVWNDCFIFDYIYFKKHSDIEKFNYWLDILDIKKSILIDKDNRINHSGLSTGQIKRLALAIALVKETGFLVLDEWAAEQSPDFKKKFYTDILPDLKSRNMGVVIVSHDDAYYKVADRIHIISDGSMLHNNQYYS